MELRSNSVRRALDGVPTTLKRTGVGATVEIVGYETDHPTIAGHPLNDEKELLAASATSTPALGGQRRPRHGNAPSPVGQWQPRRLTGAAEPRPQELSSRRLRREPVPYGSACSS